MFKKTMLYRLLIVFAACLVFLSMGSPFAFAVNESDYNSIPIRSDQFELVSDSSFPSITSYFYGTNSGIIDFYSGADGSDQSSMYNKWVRLIINNNLMRCILIKSNNNKYYLTIKLISDNSNEDCKIYYTIIGTNYRSFTSSSWDCFKLPSSSGASFLLSTVNLYAANCPFSSDLPSSDLSHCYFNNTYPLYTDNSVANKNEIISNQDRIASSQESAASSRQAEILSEGSNISVSSIDNWVENGLASKLTELAATLSSNAAIFSENQVSNQENLSRAGAFVNGVFDQFPTGIIAALICFLIILIAVKVVGR